VLLDDPQDDESARSPHQCETRHRLVHGAVLGMAGPGKRITAICPCTVIAPGDLADRMLNREESPDWTGQRYKLLYAFPKDMDLWQQYADLRADELRNDGDGSQATAFYRERREAMDLGAIVAWPERKREDELSAVQHCMNLYYQDAAAFHAEYQNEPLPANEEAGQLKTDEILTRLNGIDRGTVPLAGQKLTAFVDVQQRLLYWLVAAWSDGMGGAILDYGAYPDQQRSYFTLADAQRTLARAAPGAGIEGSIHAGLTRLTEELLSREWRRQDGAILKIEKVGIDAGYQTDTVKTFCRNSSHAAAVLPSHGRFVGAKSKPFAEYAKSPGDRFGHHWVLTAGTTQKQAVRHLLIDTNYWKSVVAGRLQVAIGDRGALTLFGRETNRHRLLADHLTAEYRVRVRTDTREVEEWQQRPERSDNHWWDCLVGAAAVASMQGVPLSWAQAPAAKPAKRSWLDDYYKVHPERRPGPRPGESL